MEYKYFSDSDFQSATPTCQMEDMDVDFMHRLDTARAISDIPYIINSAYRTEEYEKSQGRDGSSSHTKGIAVDIKAEQSRIRFLVLDGLRKAGFNRIGLGEDFIHVDSDQNKSRNVIWHYYE